MDEHSPKKKDTFDALFYPYGQTKNAIVMKNSTG